MMVGNGGHNPASVCGYACVDLLPAVTPASVRRTCAVVDAALQSVREHRVVDINLPSVRSLL